jgi:kynurenine formamidase
MSRIVDLSKTIKYRKDDPWFMRVKVKHKPHGKSKFLVRILGLPEKLMPDLFTGWSDDKVTMGVHAPTHLDAPWHYGPTVNGQPAKTIDEIPLEWCIGRGIVIDVSHKKDMEVVTVEDLQKDLARTGAPVEPGTIVLIKTGRDKLRGKEMVSQGVGMGAEATEWLVDQGVKVMGIDQWGWDLPLFNMAKEAKRRKDKEYFWQGHLVGRRKEYLHIEQMVNLDLLPPMGFTVSVLPLKIEGASAAPARVVAILDD